MSKSTYECEGWATKYNMKCTDGLTIGKDAFAHQDGAIVPVVWNHQHNSVFDVLGNALLESRPDGMYAHVNFNDTESGEAARAVLQHGDVTAFSIHANKLKKSGNLVEHGMIREVSLVLANANPGAYIEKLNLTHSEDGEEDFDDAHIYHDDQSKIVITTEEKEDPAQMEGSIEHADSEKKERTIQDVYNEMSDEQKTAVAAMVKAALDSKKKDEDDDEEEDKSEMKHNAFDKEEPATTTLSREEIAQIFKDGKRLGSLKAAVLQHCEDANDDSLMHAVDAAGNTVNYGVANLDYLFPDFKNLTNEPIFIQRDQTWVTQVMNKVHRTPFSRVKSILADITEDEARAKGYIKGKLKKEEVFTLLKRTTAPTTIYKKQKIDRDDLLDITDFNFVAWLKAEMRVMLNEEIARAILIGDGRLSSSDDKINEANIRPIYTDADLYSIKVAVPASTDFAVHAKSFIRSVIKSRSKYKGSGNPDLYMTEDLLTECLLLEDTTGRLIYDTVDKLKTALRVSNIVTVEVMEGVSRTVDSETMTLDAILVNLNDYNVGADRGGEISMFDDFDIDYNQQKYLMETRISGALIRPFSAIVFETGEVPTTGGTT